MLSKESLKTIGISFIVSIIGGGLSSCFFSQPLKAENGLSVLRASEVRIVGRNGEAQIVLKSEDNHPVVRIIDENDEIVLGRRRNAGEEFGPSGLFITNGKSTRVALYSETNSGSSLSLGHSGCPNFAMLTASQDTGQKAQLILGFPTSGHIVAEAFSNGSQLEVNDSGTRMKLVNNNRKPEIYFLDTRTKKKVILKSCVLKN